MATLNTNYTLLLNNYIYSGNNTYYLNSNIGNTGTKSSGFTFYAGETLINTVNAWANHNN